MDHEGHEMETRKARKVFVTFAAFRGFRDPKTHEATAAGDEAGLAAVEAQVNQAAASRAATSGATESHATFAGTRTRPGEHLRAVCLGRRHLKT